MKRKIKVFLCDDHKLFREGVKKLLEAERDFSVVGEAAEGKEAWQKIRSTVPDVVLMEITLPQLDGIWITRKIKKELRATNVIMLTVKKDEPQVFGAIKAGVSGYLLKESSAADLARAIRTVYQGETMLEPQIATKILKEFKALPQRKNPSDEDRYEGLTHRENDVLRWIALGAGNREIASKLDISEKTVKNHLSNIFQKLNVESRTQAALFVFREKNL
jgi:DNA-binding NarL/FixJ family response regulator